MRRELLAVCFLALLVGCEEVPSSTETSSQADLSLPISLAITERSLDEPLSSDEVRSFIELVKSLPDGKPPALSPVSSGAKVEGLRVDAAMRAWRSAVREALTVDTLIQGWSPPTSVRRALSEQHVDPRDLVSLMLRLSCSLAVETMGGPRSVAAQQVIADEKAKSLLVRIQRLNRSGQPIPDALWQALEEATSLAEYLALLSKIPAENQLLLADFQGELGALLPMPTDMQSPSESVEDNHIVPVRFEEPMVEEARPTRRRGR